MADIENKFKGTLAGLAVGDALGAPLEFMSFSQIQIKHGTVTEMLGGGWLGLRRGECTDDTAMMMCLAESLADKGKLEVEDVVQKYIAWYKSQPKGITNTIRHMLGILSDGSSVEEASQKAMEVSGYCGFDNGTLMRCAPIGLLYYRNVEGILRESMREARITHNDLRAGSASAALNLLISLALPGDKGKEEIIKEADKILEENTLGVLNVIPPLAGREEKDIQCLEGAGETFEAALFFFSRTESMEDCLIQVVNRGGDTDTAGAVAGALCGAFYGLEGIPARWLNLLKDKNLILQLARRLLSRAHPEVASP